MKLTAHIRLVLSLRMCGFIPPFPIGLHAVVLSQAQGMYSMALYLVKHRDNFTESFLWRSFTSLKESFLVMP